MINADSLECREIHQNDFGKSKVGISAVPRIDYLICKITNKRRKAYRSSKSPFTRCDCDCDILSAINGVCGIQSKCPHGVIASTTLNHIQLISCEKQNRCRNRTM